MSDPRKGCPHDFYARAEMKCLDCLATEREEARAEGYRAGIEAAAEYVLNGAGIPGYRALESNLPPGLMTHVAATIRALAAPAAPKEEA